jgi:hypothetical protein
VNGSREPTGQAISDGGWMDAAIEAAADALWHHDGYVSHRQTIIDTEPHYDGWAEGYAEDARVAVAAALPHLRAAIADELKVDGSLHGSWCDWSDNKDGRGPGDRDRFDCDCGVASLVTRARGGPLDA